jgi:hypothetical protein
VTPLSKLRIALRSWLWLSFVTIALRVYQLPELVAKLTATKHLAARHFNPHRLSYAVDRSLLRGPFEPRCLTRSLVLLRLLRAQGDDAELVIGLPESPENKYAHAWVEIGGIDVGPSPGRGRHQELARYGAP